MSISKALHFTHTRTHAQACKLHCLPSEEYSTWANICPYSLGNIRNANCETHGDEDGSRSSAKGDERQFSLHTGSPSAPGQGQQTSSAQRNRPSCEPRSPHTLMVSTQHGAEVHSNPYLGTLGVGRGAGGAGQTRLP